MAQGAGAVGFIFMEWDMGQFIAAGAISGGVTAHPIPPTYQLSSVSIEYDNRSISFTVLTDTTIFTTQMQSQNWFPPPYGYEVVTTQTPLHHAPIPAALPLFVAGLGILGWFTRKRNPLSHN